jgi:VanZ family protein
MAPKPVSQPLWLRWLCLALAAMMTFQLFQVGSQPVAAGLIPEPWDKLAHFATYSVITGLAWVGTAGRMPLAVIAAIVAVGAFDELHQGSIPGRVADAADFLVDVCAAVSTGAVMLLHDSRRRSDDA